MRRHILHRHWCHIYLKCRVKGCTLAYVSFNRIKDLNTHHKIYHPTSFYRCRQCRKSIYTPSTWCYHQYCQCPKMHKCSQCTKYYLFESTLRHHRHSHTKQKLFRCFFGSCQKSYKHPQDLNHHTTLHQQVTFTCELCDKMFNQKRLLKRHEVIHTNALPFTCTNCQQSFRQMEPTIQAQSENAP